MQEIKKLEMRIKNANLWKSPEIRLTREDAVSLLQEIKTLENAAPEIEYVKDEMNIVFTSLDGGAF